MTSLEILAAVVLRLCLFSFPSIRSCLEGRPEVNTPNTAWKRVIEGMHSTKIFGHQSNYYGSSLLLHFIKKVDAINPKLHDLVFIVLDILCALALKKLVQIFLTLELNSSKTKKSLENYGVDGKLLDGNHISRISNFVFMLYLFNPLTLLTCIAKNTVAFNNMFICYFLLNSIKGNVVSSTFFLALSTYETFYPVQLVVSICLADWKFNHQNKEGKLIGCFVKGISWFLFWMVVIFISSAVVTDDSEIFRHYKFILEVQDQTPNIGIFWYFFTEVFQHFEQFFIWVFQINAVFYCLPLSIRLRHNPVLLQFTLIACIAMFKSYAVLGDNSVWFSLIPMFCHTFMYFRDSMITISFLAGSMLVSVTMWFAWISANAANANFYFASGLAFTMAQNYLLFDVVLSVIKWNKMIEIGQSKESIENNKYKEGATLRLVY